MKARTTVTEREQWWEKLTPEQRFHLLRTAGASREQVRILSARQWYQLSKWVRKAIGTLKSYQMAVPVSQETQVTQ